MSSTSLLYKTSDFIVNRKTHLSMMFEINELLRVSFEVFQEQQKPWPGLQAKIEITLN